MASQKKKLENKGPTQQEKLALLNAENRKRNAESVRKAQLKERVRVSDVISRNSEQAADGSGERTPNKSGSNKLGGGGDGSGASTPANGSNGNGTPRSGGGVGMLPHIAKLQEQQRSLAKAGMPVIHKPLMDDDIIGALDLDIDVEID